MLGWWIFSLQLRWCLQYTRRIKMKMVFCTWLTAGRTHLGHSKPMQYLTISAEKDLKTCIFLPVPLVPMMCFMSCRLSSRIPRFRISELDGYKVCSTLKLILDVMGLIIHVLNMELFLSWSCDFIMNITSRGWFTCHIPFSYKHCGGIFFPSPFVAYPFQGGSH